MRAMLVAALGCVSMLVAGVAAADVSPQQLEAARALADAGLEMHNAQRWKECFERFQAAEAIYHAPPHVQYMARCKAGMGELVEAERLYRQLADEKLPEGAPQIFLDAQAAAREEVAALSARVPRVTIVVKGSAAANITIDGKQVEASTPTPLDPGTHRVQIAAEGFAAIDETFEVAESSSPELAFELEPLAGDDQPPPPEGPAEPNLVGPGVLMGVGLAGIAVGIATGVVALGKSDDLDAACPVRTQCPRENEALEDDANTFGIVSTVGFVVGGAAIAGGVVWLVIELISDEPAEAAWLPWSDGRQVGAMWRF